MVAELRVHRGLPPVQVGLAGQEVVQVVLAAGLVQGPRGLPGGGDPVVRRPAAGAPGRPTRSSRGAPRPGR